jgi:DNA-binding beta-propeller fold protein YncE
MRPLSRGIAFVSTVLAAAAVGAASARADGLPVLGIDVGSVGVVSPSGFRYVTVPAGPSTVVARVDAHSGRILRYRLLRGWFTIPAVAYDGSASGLSADGRTLVLIQPRTAFPRARTTLTVLDTRNNLRPRRSIRLRGDFSYDAVSPRGRWLYLIQYVSPQDPTRYLVRAYDLRTGRLRAKPVVDPHETGEMRGSPITRATSPDGRWAYTLYDGAGKTPFVHALDTRRLTARCIDLDALAGADLSLLRLSVRSRTLTVRTGQQPLVVVDTRTFRTSTPSVAAAPAPQPAREGTKIPWTPLALVVAAMLAGLVVLSLALRRRHRLAPTAELAPRRT